MAMLKIHKDFIPRVGMFGIVHSHNMHNHPIDHICRSIDLGGKVVYSVSLVSITDHKVDQNVFKKSLALASTMILFLQGVKMTILEK